ncbi:hypothetical protein [Oryzobacter terrae]|uniref:hypothetical protein n=1 Tax=Oryzobacter terrae TaxID=1620385 RepID=UPI00366B4AE2
MTTSIPRAHRISRVLLVTGLAGVGIVQPATIAMAADPSVTLTADSVLGEEGTFTADGGPCASGTTAEPGGVTVTERRKKLVFDLEKVFTCSDGSGSFTVRIHATYQPCLPSDRGVWTVVGGTGRHTALRGHGTLVGTYWPGPCDDAQGITDVLVGTMRAR